MREQGRAAGKEPTAEIGVNFFHIMKFCDCIYVNPHPNLLLQHTLDAMRERRARRRLFGLELLIDRNDVQ